MPLQQCPECGGNISDLAYACPRCGRPLRAVTIERTAKTWKLVTLIGACIMVIALSGIASMVSAANSWSSIAASVPARIFLAGLAVSLLGRTGAWWNNG